ncbi:hypothetical protein PGB25_06200 [Lactiplantibacillus plantarum]|nr:hypothetical protein [Lactiplantibacillus plantarum]WCE44614.1 hypothetical protein PGB25_06200 [Lactiplantibacillus plantarum]
MQVLKQFWRQITVTVIFIGLVIGFVVLLATNNTATVNIANVNIRSGPGMSYAIEDATSKGTKVHIMKRKIIGYTSVMRIINSAGLLVG